MIFVTVGTQKFEFNRLLIKIDELVEQGVIAEPVFAQTGVSSYKPKHYEYKNFVPRDAMNSWMNKADIIITHGGTGSIIGALKCGKKVIAVPRLAAFHEHVDDHQKEIVIQLTEDGLIEGVLDMENLKDAIVAVKNKEYKKFISNNQNVIDQLRTWIRE